MIMTQWQTGELCFEEKNGSRQIDCGISGTFTAPSGRVISRAAFWDGGDTYKIRFAPTELGQWQYRITGLTGGDITDTVSCVPYEGDLPIYRHGFLKTGPRGKYLCHSDNTPFFWLGDTHWQFAVREKWDASNDPRFNSQFRAIVDRRVEQHFNVYQCNFHCERGGDAYKSGITYFFEGELRKYR